MPHFYIRLFGRVHKANVFIASSPAYQRTGGLHLSLHDQIPPDVLLLSVSLYVKHFGNQRILILANWACMRW